MAFARRVSTHLRLLLRLPPTPSLDMVAGIRTIVRLPPHPFPSHPPGRCLETPYRPGRFACQISRLPHAHSHTHALLPEGLDPYFSSSLCCCYPHSVTWPYSFVIHPAIINLEPCGPLFLSSSALSTLPTKFPMLSCFCEGPVISTSSF